MFRTKEQILRDLDPSNPASIQALIDFHRHTFDGFLMKDGDDGAAGGGDGKDGKPGGDNGGDGKDGQDGKAGDGDAPLGPAGIKALQAERDARAKLETELKDFKAAQADQSKKLAEAFGIKTDDGQSSDDVVTALQKQVQDMQRDNLVYRVVTDPAHPITDADELELIKAVPDEATMRKLAARLHKKADEAPANDRTRRFPRQDQSQGRGTGADGAKPTSVAQVKADRAAARAAK